MVSTVVRPTKEAILLWTKYVSEEDVSEVRLIGRKLVQDFISDGLAEDQLAAYTKIVEYALVVQFEENGTARPKFVHELPAEYVLVREAIGKIAEKMYDRVALTSSNLRTMAAGILIHLIVVGSSQRGH